MDFEDVIEGMAFEGDAFAPASIVCDTRDGELAVVVSQNGEDIEVRLFSNPTQLHRGKTIDFTPVEDQRLACVGFVVDSLDNDESHTANAIAQVSRLLQRLPVQMIDLIRSSTA